VDAPQRISIRPLGADDSIEELTSLLHRSYAVLGEMGLNYTAVDQTSEVTLSRMKGAVCLLATFADGRIVGTAMFYPPEEPGGSPWFDRPDVAKCGQFGVDPPFQNRGVGGQLMQAVEDLARAGGASEIALDTAEPALHLIEWYSRRGYRFIEYTQWEGKCYRSVILSKPLRPTSPA
jgi:GNAT superfamily N-acetyltransferase